MVTTNGNLDNKRSSNLKKISNCHFLLHQLWQCAMARKFCAHDNCLCHRIIKVIKVFCYCTSSAASDYETQCSRLQLLWNSSKERIKWLKTRYSDVNPEGTQLVNQSKQESTNKNCEVQKRLQTRVILGSDLKEVEAKVAIDVYF